MVSLLGELGNNGVAILQLHSIHFFNTSVNIAERAQKGYYEAIFLFFTFTL